MSWTKVVVVHRGPAMEGAAQLCHTLHMIGYAKDSHHEGMGSEQSPWRNY
jgi:hypothetical protein